MFIGLTVVIVSMILFIVALTMLLPRLLLRVKYNVDEPQDRGLKRCIVGNKRCVVFRSEERNRPYIKQFLLTCDENGEKLLKCKCAKGIHYLDYDVVTFDRYDKVIEVINVKEDVCQLGVTRNVVLPRECSYVSIIIRGANETEFVTAPMTAIPKKSIFGYSVCVFLLSMLESFIIKISCAYTFGGVFRESFASSADSILLNLLISITLCLIGGATVIMTIWKRNRS